MTRDDNVKATREEARAACQTETGGINGDLATIKSIEEQSKETRYLYSVKIQCYGNNRKSEKQPDQNLWMF